MYLSDRVKNKAKEIGFDMVGISSAEPFHKAYETLKKRKLSQFVNNDIQLLTDPGKHLKSASSIIALGLSYASEDNISNSKNDQFISLYARGKDYHLVMQEKINLLIDYLNKIEKNLEYVAYSDTGPILDREVAYRAGLGWFGKNNNLINPVYGSFIILGEIITNLKMKYDKPIESKCGDCNLCIKNCPTSALKDYNLEADKCLSYITQKKGIISEDNRILIGNNLWGCDRCLEICPYNKDIPVNLHEEFIPKIKGDIKEVLSFTKDNIPEDWKKSALSWRGLRILKRNSIINIANNRNAEYIPLLKKELNNNSPILRAYVVWALGKLNKEKAIDLLKKHYKKENNRIVKGEIKDMFKFNGWGDIL
ncbi:MAG: tRNA epoxyqueuosine(34) reductase QueG [bacterium]